MINLYTLHMIFGKKSKKSPISWKPLGLRIFEATFRPNGPQNSILRLYRSCNWKLRIFLTKWFSSCLPSNCCGKSRRIKEKAFKYGRLVIILLQCMRISNPYSLLTIRGYVRPSGSLRHSWLTIRKDFSILIHWSKMIIINRMRNR